MLFLVTNVILKGLPAGRRHCIGDSWRTETLISQSVVLLRPAVVSATTESFSSKLNYDADTVEAAF